MKLPEGWSEAEVLRCAAGILDREGWKSAAHDVLFCAWDLDPDQTLAATAAPDSPSTGLEGLSNSYLSGVLEAVAATFNDSLKAKVLEAASRLRHNADAPLMDAVANWRSGIGAIPATQEELRLAEAFDAARRLRLRVPTGLSDAEILERAADVLLKLELPMDVIPILQAFAKLLRSEQNTQKPTKEKDAE